MIAAQGVAAFVGVQIWLFLLLTEMSLSCLDVHRMLNALAMATTNYGSPVY